MHRISRERKKKTQTCSRGRGASGRRNRDAGLERTAARGQQHVVGSAGPGGGRSRDAASGREHGRHDASGGGCHGYNENQLNGKLAARFKKTDGQSKLVNAVQKNLQAQKGRSSFLSKNYCAGSPSLAGSSSLNL